MENDAIIWVHSDDLNPKSRTLMENEGLPAIFVWDEDLMQRWHVSLKQIISIYECLLELPIVIKRGDVADQVAAFARLNGAKTIITTFSVSPRFQEICKRLGQDGFKIKVVEPIDHYEIEEDENQEQYSTLWNEQQKLALNP